MKKRHNFKKKWGQNFLKDKNLLEKIANEIECNKDDLIIEIGAGEGDLTHFLLKKAPVLSYEIDLDLKEGLEERFQGGSVFFVFDDFLKRDLKEDLKKFNYNNLYLIANIPYYITTAIIRKMTEIDDLDKMVLLMQKEVGERLSSNSGKRAYSAITVIINHFFEVKKSFEISKKAFYPEPKVDSVVLIFVKKAKNAKINDKKFIDLVFDAFKYKRKTLINNLSKFGKEKIKGILKEIGKSENIRAEALDLEDFYYIYNKLF